MRRTIKPTSPRANRTLARARPCSSGIAFIALRSLGAGGGGPPPPFIVWGFGPPGLCTPPGPPHTQGGPLSPPPGR
ncbi:hypothetical protein EJ591_26860, partial [Pseudomonas aeruginosa]